MKDKFWTGEVPLKCEFDERTELAAAFWDARLPQGCWAIICGRCHTALSCGVGPGHGQQYVKQEDGRWKKLQG